MNKLIKNIFNPKIKQTNKTYCKSHKIFLQFLSIQQMFSCFEKEEFRSDTKLLSIFSSDTSSDSLSSSSQSLSSGLWIDDRKSSHRSRSRNSPIISTTLAATRPRRRPTKMKKKSASLASTSSNSDTSSKITSSSSVSSISSALNSSDNDLYLYEQSTAPIAESYTKLDKNGLLNRYIADSTEDNRILSDIPYQNFDTMCKNF